MEIIAPAHWRREGYIIHPYLSPESIRYSRGQIVHADYLFFRSPASLGHDVNAKIRLGLIAMALGYFDHALMAFEDKDVAGQLWEKFSVDPNDLIGPPSRRYGRAVLRRQIWRQLRGLVPLLRYLKNY